MSNRRKLDRTKPPVRVDDFEKPIGRRKRRAMRRRVPVISLIHSHDGGTK